jgi:LPS sulfotransferase NodH
MVKPSQCYVIACTPRSGSHLLADGLAQTGIAGLPRERFPKPSEHMLKKTPAERAELMLKKTPAERAAYITKPPPESSYNDVLDAEYVSSCLDFGTTSNGVFGITIHRFQIDDAVRRIGSYLKVVNPKHHDALSAAFPNLSYIWLRRRDKIAQAVSWHKAVQSGIYVHMHGSNETDLKKDIEFDYTAIRTYWSAIRSSDSSWQYYFSESRQTPLVVWYEDLAVQYAETIKRTLAFLKLNSTSLVIAPPRHRKAADTQSLEWIKRFKNDQARSRGVNI